MKAKWYQYGYFCVSCSMDNYVKKFFRWKAPKETKAFCTCEFCKTRELVELQLTHK